MFHVCFCYVILSVPCNLVITWWERIDLLALLCFVFLVFCHFPEWCPVSGVVLDCIDSWFLTSSLLLIEKWKQLRSMWKKLLSKTHSLKEKNVTIHRNGLYEATLISTNTLCYVKSKENYFKLTLIKYNIHYICLLTAGLGQVLSSQ